MHVFLNFITLLSFNFKYVCLVINPEVKNSCQRKDSRKIARHSYGSL